MKTNKHGESFSDPSIGSLERQYPAIRDHEQHKRANQACETWLVDAAAFRKATRHLLRELHGKRERERLSRALSDLPAAVKAIERLVSGIIGNVGANGRSIRPIDNRAAENESA